MMGGTLSVDLERLAGARVLVLFFPSGSYRGRTFWRCPTMKRRRLDLCLYFVRFFKDIVAPIENPKVCYSSS